VLVYAAFPAEKSSQRVLEFGCGIVRLNICRRNTDSARVRARVTAQFTRTAITIVLLWRAFAAAAQDVTEPTLKAAYIYNFTKFTDWPADVVPPGGRLTICAIGDPEVASALERAVKVRQREDHPLVITRLPGDAPPRGCQLVWMSKLSLKQVAAVVTASRDAPVLTISDIDGFINVGGMAYFYFEHGQLRFHVDAEAARRARLDISSRLLALSKKP
jgi:hypothetical protein